MKILKVLFVFITVVQFALGSELIEKGGTAPTFVLPIPTGGREYLRIWCGEKLMKPYVNNVKHRVILSFWSMDCEPCLKEIPELHTFAEKHANDSLKVFLVNLDKSGVGELNEFVQEQKWTLPVLWDRYKKTFLNYGGSRIPTLIVISPDGVIEHAFTGIPEGYTADEYLEQLIYNVSADTTDQIVSTETNK